MHVLFSSFSSLDFVEIGLQTLHSMDSIENDMHLYFVYGQNIICSYITNIRCRRISILNILRIERINKCYVQRNFFSSNNLQTSDGDEESRSTKCVASSVLCCHFYCVRSSKSVIRLSNCMTTNEMDMVEMKPKLHKI